MSTYCIGDLHGRYDLFQMLLNKINFDLQKDILYFLGDAIDHNYGGISIIRYMMQHRGSCVFIRGNHEEYFLSNTPILDIIISDTNYKNAILEIGKHPSIFKQLFNLYSHSLSLSHFLTSGDVYKWSHEGNVVQRKKLLDAIWVFSRNWPSDSSKLMPFFLCLNQRYKTREFINELFTIQTDEYHQIKEFLNSTPKTIDLCINERNFKLIHNIRHIDNINYPQIFALPQIESINTYYIYGHDPVPGIYKKINENTGFEFDFRRIFSFVDINNNYWYNLDLASNPIAALRLDDLCEFYVGIPATKNNEKNWEVPCDLLEYQSYRYDSYTYPLTVSNKSFKRITKNRFVIVTFKGNSYERLIAVDKSNNVIYYTRISWLDHYKPVVIIKDPSISQMEIEDILERTNSFEENI